MTPITRPQAAPHSLFPARLAENSPVLRQRYVVARILEGEGRSLSPAGQDPLSLGQRVARLPIAERERLREEAGSAFDAFVALSEESVPEYFFAGLLRAGRQAEDQDRFGAAQRCYFFLARLSDHGMAVPEHIQRQARERLAVLGGGGSGWDRVEFGLHRLPAQTLDPAFLVGMGTAAIIARGFRLRLLLGAARGPGITPRFVPQIFRAGVSATVESLAYVGGQTATAGILGRPVSYDSVREEWLRFGLPMFLGSRLAGSLAGQGYRRIRTGGGPWLEHGSLEGARFRHRLGYGLLTQSAMLGAAYFAQGLDSETGRADRIPRDPIAQALVWTLTFSAFNSGARRLTGRRVLAWERGLFRR